MNVDSRRGFLKGFGLLSAVVAGATTSGLANAASSGMGLRPAANPVLSPPGDIGHLAPLGKVNLTLMADNNPPPPPPPVEYYNTRMAMDFTPKGTLDSPTFMTSVPTATPMLMVGAGSAMTDKNNVKMSVGKDNRLWIEVDGKWRRVALEG